VPYVDLLVAVVILIFAGKGLVKGFFVEALTFLGFIVALFIMANFYKELGNWVGAFFSLNAKILSVVVFIVGFILITFAFGLVGNMLTKATKALKLSGLNRAFGGMFGAAKGAFACGIFLAVITEQKLFASLVAKAQESMLAPYLIEFANGLLKLLDL